MLPRRGAAGLRDALRESGTDDRIFGQIGAGQHAAHGAVVEQQDAVAFQELDGSPSCTTPPACRRRRLRGSAGRIPAFTETSTPRVGSSSRMMSAIGDQRARHQHLLLVAAATAPGSARRRRSAGELHRVQPRRRAGALAAGRSQESAAPAAMRPMVALASTSQSGNTPSRTPVAGDVGRGSRQTMPGLRWPPAAACSACRNSRWPLPSSPARPTISPAREPDLRGGPRRLGLDQRQRIRR